MKVPAATLSVHFCAGVLVRPWSGLYDVLTGALSASLQRLRAQGGLGQGKQKMNHPPIRLYIFLANVIIFVYRSSQQLCLE